MQNSINFFFHKNYKKDVDLFKIIIDDSRLSKDEQNQRRLIRLNKLIRHAYENVPYYTKLFDKSEINTVKGFQSLSEISLIPILSKDEIRNQGQELYYTKHKDRNSYTNTSGGSTGAPIKVIQDKFYANESSAMFLFVKRMREINPYGSTAVLWGAARDLYGGKNTFKGHVRDFITNTKSFNSAKLSKPVIESFLKYINAKKPDLILAYAQSIYQMALYIQQNGLRIEKQNAIHTGAGQMFPFMREIIESVFQCKVFDHYGGREFGALASECKYGSGLHVLGYNRIIEILDNNNNQCKPNEEGEIVTTVLDNYSMPLIRYKVGDLGIWSSEIRCKCGNNYQKIARITGRTSNNFLLKEGGVVSGEYLTLTYNHVAGIINFQIRQKAYEKIIIYLVVDEAYSNETEIIIRNKFLKLFGLELQLHFEYVDEIQTTSTGKHLFTISEISN